MTSAQPMRSRPGWNYETPRALFQLWPPQSSERNWCAAWTETRKGLYRYLEEEDDGWRPACDFGRGATPAEAMRCFPHNITSDLARRSLLQAALPSPEAR